MIHRKQNRFVWLLKPLSVMAVLVSVFGTVWLRSSVVSLEYRLSSLEKKKAGLMREAKTLMAERASLLSVERFENVAMNGLGFTFPDRVKVVYVKKAGDNEPRKASLSADGGVK